MKATDHGRTLDTDAVSGSCHANPVPPPPDCSPDGATCVFFDDGSDPTKAASVAAMADVAIVFLSTDSSEGSDRRSLSLDGNGDSLVPAVAKAATSARTVVAATTPGAVLMPWKDEVAAITTAFMPGQEYGNALADVIFGNVNPSAKLPLTFPLTENQVGFTQEQWPGVNKVRCWVLPCATRGRREGRREQR